MPCNPTTPGPQGDNPVARFPPLPAIPPAPQQPPDERQAKASQIIGGLAGAVETEMQVAGPNLTTGYYASSVDLGRLQAELGKGVARLTAAQLGLIRFRGQVGYVVPSLVSMLSRARADVTAAVPCAAWA